MALKTYPGTEFPDRRGMLYDYMISIGVRPHVYDAIQHVQQLGFAPYSDGISWLNGLPFYLQHADGTKMWFLKHPIGVSHDHQYRTATIMGEPCSRKESDLWFRDALIDFGYPIRARVYYYALRLFAGGVWQRYRNMEDPELSEPVPR